MNYQPSRRTVFGSHDQTAHVWAQNNVESGRASDDRINFSNGVIYSYGRHFPIARFMETKAPDGRAIVLFTGAGYSTSTAKHISIVRRALHGSRALIAHVPDLRVLGGYNPESALTQVAELLIRRAESENADNYQHSRADRLVIAKAFYAEFLPDAKFPRDLSAFVRALDKRDEKHKRDCQLATDKEQTRDAARIVERARSRAAYAREQLTAPRAENERELSPYDAKRNAHSCGAARKQCFAAIESAKRLGLKRFPYDALGECAKEFLRVQKLWNAKATEIEAKEARERARRHLRDQIGYLKAGKDGWRLAEAARNVVSFWAEVDQAARDAAMAYLAREALSAEIESTHAALNPNANDVLTARNLARYGHKQVTREEWQNGATGSYPYFPDETLLRKKGDNLETSRGASCPYRHAEIAFQVAQRCVHTSTSWHRNGHTIHVGHFQVLAHVLLVGLVVDSIDENGTMRAGCHTLAFAEMQRLAIKESPALVKARYPLPAIVR